MSKYVYGLWESWNGVETPVDPETVVQVQNASQARHVVENSNIGIGKAGTFAWGISGTEQGKQRDIIAYRSVSHPSYIWTNKSTTGSNWKSKYVLLDKNVIISIDYKLFHSILSHVYVNSFRVRSFTSVAESEKFCNEHLSSVKKAIAAMRQAEGYLFTK